MAVEELRDCSGDIAWREAVGRRVDLSKLQDDTLSLLHGPCYPLTFTSRFSTWRIEDVHGNVVIEHSGGDYPIDLAEARDHMIECANAMPALLEKMRKLMVLQGAVERWRRSAYSNDAEILEAMDELKD